MVLVLILFVYSILNISCCKHTYLYIESHIMVLRLQQQSSTMEQVNLTAVLRNTMITQCSAKSPPLARIFFRWRIKNPFFR